MGVSLAQHPGREAVGEASLCSRKRSCEGWKHIAKAEVYCRSQSARGRGVFGGARGPGGVRIVEEAESMAGAEQIVPDVAEQIQSARRQSPHMFPTSPSYCLPCPSCELGSNLGVLGRGIDPSPESSRIRRCLPCDHPDAARPRTSQSQPLKLVPLLEGEVHVGTCSAVERPRTPERMCVCRLRGKLASLVAAAPATVNR